MVKKVRNVWRKESWENVHSIFVSKLYPDFEVIQEVALLFHFQHTSLLAKIILIRICQPVKDDQSRGANACVQVGRR